MRQGCLLSALACLSLLTGCGAAEFTAKASNGGSTIAASGDATAAGDPSTPDQVTLPSTDPSAKVNDSCSSGNPHKTLICHVPPGNPANRHTICIGTPAVSHHLQLHIAHGDPNYKDTLGLCPGDKPADVIDVDKDGDPADQE